MLNPANKIDHDKYLQWVIRGHQKFYKAKWFWIHFPYLLLLVIWERNFSTNSPRLANWKWKCSTITLPFSAVMVLNRSNWYFMQNCTFYSTFHLRLKWYQYSMWEIMTSFKILNATNKVLNTLSYWNQWYQLHRVVILLK